MSTFPRKVICLAVAIALTATAAIGQIDRADRQLQYILDRYLEVMGGSALLENLNSLYMTGNLTLPDDTRIPISILKKRPGKVRIIQYLPNFRLIQGFNGEEAWISRQYEDSVHTRLLDGEEAQAIIDAGAIESVLVDERDTGAALELIGETTIARSPCYRIRATFPDGTRREFLIEMDTLLDRRLYDYDAEGNLLKEYIPGDFKTFQGVLFAMQQRTFIDSKLDSTLVLDDVQINLGILDSLFDPPSIPITKDSPAP